MTRGKVRGLKCIKLATHFFLKKGPFGENIFIGEKKCKFG
jgi:hypothetical protein